MLEMSTECIVQKTCWDQCSSLKKNLRHWLHTAYFMFVFNRVTEKLLGLCNDLEVCTATGNYMNTVQCNLLWSYTYFVAFISDYCVNGEDNKTYTRLETPKFQFRFPLKNYFYMCEQLKILVRLLEVLTLYMTIIS